MAKQSGEFSIVYVGEKNIPKQYKFYIKLLGKIIASNLKDLLACILANASKFKPGGVYLLVYNKGAIEYYLLISLKENLKIEVLKDPGGETLKALRLSYPSLKELSCPEDIKAYLSQVKSHGEIVDRLKKNLLLIVLFLVGLGIIGYYGYEEFLASSPPPSPPPKPKVVSHPKPLKKKEEKPFCYSNLPAFVENFVLGAKVGYPNATENEEKKGIPYIYYRTKNGNLIKISLTPSKWYKKFDSKVKIIFGINVYKTKLGYEFKGNDYDLCLGFISQNTDKPLYIVSLDEKGCEIYLPRDCFKLMTLPSLK